MAMALEYFRWCGSHWGVGGFELPQSGGSATACCFARVIAGFILEDGRRHLAHLTVPGLLRPFLID
jgi:hypothetical protein